MYGVLLRADVGERVGGGVRGRGVGDMGTGQVPLRASVMPGGGGRGGGGKGRSLLRSRLVRWSVIGLSKPAVVPVACR